MDNPTIHAIETLPDIISLFRVKLILPETAMAAKVFHPSLDVSLAEGEDGSEIQRLLDELDPNKRAMVYFDIIVPRENYAGNTDNLRELPRGLITYNVLPVNFGNIPEVLSNDASHLDLEIYAPTKAGTYTVESRVRQGNFGTFSEISWEAPWMDTGEIRVLEPKD